MNRKRSSNGGIEMALAKELLGLGFSAGQASGIGGQYASITAAGAGTDNSDATAIKASMTVIAGADGTKGAVLPACEVGGEIWLFNNAGSTCKLWPDTGAAICVPGTGLGTVNAAFSFLTYKTALLKRVTSTQWLINISA
jgi:hypothetical protein